jgi:hypothetical protein
MRDILAEPPPGAYEALRRTLTRDRQARGDALEKLVGSAWFSSEKLQRELGWQAKRGLGETLRTS